MAEILLGRLVGPSGFKRPVVIKRILPHMVRDQEIVSMFLDEARIIAGIRHPNVVTVHELGNEDGELFLVLEYLEGESASGLSRRLTSRDEKLDHRLAAFVVAEACAGLHAAHELTNEAGQKQNLVHRDVSPQNIFVTYDGSVKVLDFGIATAADRSSKTEAGQLKGKVEYMSPEQCLGKDLDRRTDVFALGVVLYELSTGRRLFKRANHLLSFKAICQEPVIRPSEIVVDYPPALEGIVMRALSKQRAERYQSALEMRRELLTVIHDLGGGRDPAEELGELMNRLFPDRIGQKTDMLRRVSQGSEITDVPAAETDDSIEIPGISSIGDTAPPPPMFTAPPPEAAMAARSRRGPLIAAAIVLVVAGVAAGGWYEASAARREKAGAGPTAPATAIPVAQPTVAAPSTAAQPESVVVDVETVPSGASVVLDGKVMGVAPMQLTLPRGSAGVRLELRKTGYASTFESVVPDANQRLRLTLVAQAAAHPALTAAAAAKPKPTAQPAATPTATPAPTQPANHFQRFD